MAAPLTLVEYGDVECFFCARAPGFTADLRERLSCVVGIGAELWNRLCQAPRGIAEVVAEVHVFRFWDERDLPQRSQGVSSSFRPRTCSRTRSRFLTAGG